MKTFWNWINFHEDLLEFLGKKNAHTKSSGYKTNKWNYIKLKSLCITKEKNEKATYEQNICISDELISKIYKELSQHNNWKTNNSIKSWATELGSDGSCL
jgi:hypothetical protein